MKRYVIEYANDKLRSLEQGQFFGDVLKKGIDSRDIRERWQRIDKAVNFYRLGLITEDEAIRTILEA